MSDIFREVEEEVQREKLAKFWKAYGDYVIALIALIVVGIAGFELWQRYENTQRDKASVAFVDAQRVTNPAQAAALYAALEKNAPGGYGPLAKLSEANADLMAGKADTAIALYKDIAESDSGPLGAVARIRAAWLLADNAPRADLAALLQPLNDPANAWRQMAREVLAYSDYKSGNTKDALAAFTALAADPDSPNALRNRAVAFSAFLRGGGAANYGTVPPPAPVTTPGTPPAAAPAGTP